ncbi:ATP-binding protein [Streptomyces albipurpureus]|uniref:ATP-binding protein n=1 Tax=Streptomyces albipurpureus TaxID=2897419 RepID=A0ABT0UXQ6_9ACTN|nr:ATP-binding protein [Streptomyces sp. CWNU-1]MCM2393352.1 ATP-binding protein [Streptomyces sp. CWNU-1]
MSPSEIPIVPSPAMPTWSMGYAMNLASVPCARAHARRQLATWEWGGSSDDGVLIVSELVSNAVRHGSRPGHDLRLRLVLPTPRDLLIEVSDPVAAFPDFDRVLTEDGEAESGRGLFLVRALGAHLSWYARPQLGKTVRASIPAPARTNHPASGSAQQGVDRTSRGLGRAVVRGHGDAGERHALARFGESGIP